MVHPSINLKFRLSRSSKEDSLSMIFKRLTIIIVGLFFTGVETTTKVERIPFY